MDKKLISDFINTTHEIQRLTEKQSSIRYDKKVVSKLQFFALKIIYKEKEITVGELAEILTMSSGSIAQLIERLMEKGWITKEVDKEDKRIFHLLLTKKGEKEISKMEEIFQQKIASLLSLMPEHDLKQMLTIFKNLLEKLKKERC